MSAAIAELALRAFGIGYPALYYPDPYCASRLQPSTSGVWIEEGYGHISINALGFRGPEIRSPKESGTLRVAVLGDSFIEALQVDRENSFCAQLEERLTEFSDDRQKFEVINCGVSGFGTAQELLMLRHHVLPLAPDAVLLCVFPDNDLWNNSRRLAHEDSRPYFALDENNELTLDDSFRHSAEFLAASTRFEQVKRSVVNRSRLLQVLKRAKRMLLHEQPVANRSFLESLHATIRKAEYVYRDTFESDHQTAWQVTERLIGEIASECQSRNIECLVFTASSPVQVYPDEKIRDELIQRNSLGDLLYADRRLVKFCSQSSIPFFPLASQLAAESESKEAYFHGFGRSLGTGHWNETGHATAARLVADFLIQQNVLQTEKSKVVERESVSTQ